jgi:DNA-directed RNA polymerase specialized sigma24 family protein
MISDQSIRGCLLGCHTGLVLWFQHKFQYDIEDLVQECQLYLVKRPLSDRGFIRAHVKTAMVDLMRKEMGQSRQYKTREAFERGSKRACRTQAIWHSLDNPLDQVAINLVFVEPNVSDLPSIVATAMQKLSLRERLIIIYRFWFDEGFNAIGHRLGVSGPRIHLLLKRALPKLKLALPPKGDLF